MQSAGHSLSLEPMRIKQLLFIFLWALSCNYRSENVVSQSCAVFILILISYIL